MTNIDFKETQRFKIWWAWLGIAAMNVLFIYAITQQVIFGKPFGTMAAPDNVLILVELFFILLLIFLMLIRLKTRITDDGIYYQFYPFQFAEKRIEWHELRDAYIRQYNSLYEYGGWGIRYGSPKTGRAVNTPGSSSMGLQLQFNDGNLLLIGTARPDELKLIIEDVIKAGKINRGI